MAGLYDEFIQEEVVLEEGKIVFDNEKDRKQFDKYLEELGRYKNFGQLEADSDNLLGWQNWQHHFRNLYKLIVNDAFVALGRPVPAGMEVYFAGSLARAQATPFSDLDAFVLLEDEADIDDVKHVFQGINNLCQRIFYEKNQCYPDPIGMNPGVLTGTPDTLFDLLDGGEVADVPVTTRSIMSSLPIFGNFELGNILKDKIRQSDLATHFTPINLYKKAIKDYKAPENGLATINIKSHILRPIDFIFMGLREEFDLYSEDGSHLSVPGTIRLLRAKLNNNEIDLSNEDEDAINFIVKTYYQAIEKRCQLHGEHKAEHDTMPRDEAEEMLARVEALRQMAVRRRTNLLTQQASANEPKLVDLGPVETESFWVKHQNKLKAAATAVLILAGGFLGTFLIPIPGVGSVIGGVVGGAIGTGTGLGLSLTGLGFLELFKKNPVKGTALSTIGSAGLGAGIGAILGTVAFPGIGTAIGAAIGAGVGLSAGLAVSGLANFVLKNPKTATALTTAGSAGLGAGVGALLGTLVFPGVGTLIGLAIGAGVGASASLFATGIYNAVTKYPISGVAMTALGSFGIGAFLGTLVLPGIGTAIGAAIGLSVTLLTAGVAKAVQIYRRPTHPEDYMPPVSTIPSASNNKGPISLVQGLNVSPPVEYDVNSEAIIEDQSKSSSLAAEHHSTDEDEVREGISITPVGSPT
ncbi:substrate of the Dot/Icm secretion system [Legionella beliardensis]|uniref:Substrate of the Dot/Icm secretion system n=1 Tax=Legionella beliardensis TaxID=91822 RepID=A0A378I0N4_9GAMM|nr:hypothetical protein [Legionella beliardensis]STX28270.1 substrate of the Dot/Icm secretion system [Legionella beliardensis]